MPVPDQLTKPGARPERETHIVQGLGREERDRIAVLRTSGQFFWLDISLSETGLGDLASALNLPERVMQPLGFGSSHPASRRFYADGQYVVFPFACYIEPTEDSAESFYRTRSVEVHVLVSSEYILTLHDERGSLPAILAPDLPANRTPQYVVYAVLEAMVASAFDSLNEVEDALDALAVTSADLRGGRVRIGTLRAIAARLARMRREVGRERAVERIGVEIERLPGLEADDKRYFDRLANQVDRLVNAIEAASDTMTTLVDLRLNETSYWLTVVATIFLPLTFVTGFFGMNFNWMIDEIDTELAFLLLGVGSCVASVLVVWRLLVRALPVEADLVRPSPPSGDGVHSNL
jgi:magnesium transporter